MSLKPANRKKKRQESDEYYNENAVKSMAVKSVSPILIPTPLYGEITRKRIKIVHG